MKILLRLNLWYKRKQLREAYFNWVNDPLNCGNKLREHIDPKESKVNKLFDECKLLERKLNE